MRPGPGLVNHLVLAVALVACGRERPAHAPVTPASAPARPTPASADAICRARLSNDVVATFETHAREGTSTCDERAHLAAHYFDVQLETYDRWQPQLDEHFVWLASHCPDTDQTCTLTLMPPSVALVEAWTGQVEANTTHAVVRRNANAVQRQAKHIAELRDQPGRFAALTTRAREAYDADDTPLAAALATEALLLISLSLHPTSWNTGNQIHEAHMTLGRIALRAGDIPAAKRHLLASGRTPGSPQLESFGPKWNLASELLAAGERDVVIEYLELCKAFWGMAGSSLDEWQRELRNGETPMPLAPRR